MQEGIFSSTLSKEDTCFNDIANVKLPEPLCPFGCKKKKCPYDYDADRCPHDLSKKSLEELSDYTLKSFYYGDEGVGADYEGQVDPKMLAALQKMSRPGNVKKLKVVDDGASRPNNNKV